MTDLQGAAAEENVVMRAGDCSVTVMPRLGGKIASIRISDPSGRELELMQAPLAPYAPRTQTMPFDAADASGWDECLPSVAACSVQTASGPAHIPDHGDLWRVAWQPLSIGLSSLTHRAKCFSLPLRIERTITLTASGDNHRLSLQYSVTNLAMDPTPWSWAAHPLFVAEEGDRILLPNSIETLRLEGSGGGRLGQNGAAVSWPIATLADGGQTDLSVAHNPSSAIGDKLFAGPLGPSENWCTLQRPKAGVQIKVGFDPAATPYLGLWICYGGWPERPGPKQVCVAMEPATAPVDSLAERGPWSRSLSAGDTFSWWMNVDIESI